MTFVRREIRGFIRVLKSSRKLVIVEFILGADSGVGRFCDWPAVAWAYDGERFGGVPFSGWLTCTL